MTSGEPMTMASTCRVSVWAVMLLLAVGRSGFSQTTTGTIVGIIHDQTGGVLPGAKVILTSSDTGRTIEIVTNSVGQYVVTLPIGNYEITFVLPNFQPFTTRGISLHLNDRLQVNAKLVVGAVETLTVTAERLVQPTSAVRNLIQPEAVRELPLLTRTPIQLVTLVPGVSSDLREDACFCDQGNLDITINGARRSSVNWLLDGASNVNTYNNFTLVTTPSLDAIQEITVITSTYQAEWARNGGGLVNVVTKAGANRFSGSAYDFVRNDALNANYFFRNMATQEQINSAPPRLRYNNLGFTVGGPALPNRKNMFFFFSGDWRRSTRAKGTRFLTVPDPRWLSDPASPNYVPPEARDPNAVKLLALWPAPSEPGTNSYRRPITTALDTHQQFVRLDATPNGRWSLGGRYLHDRVDSLGEYTTPDLEAGHRYSSGHLGVLEARQIGERLVQEYSYQVSTNRLSRMDRAYTRAELGLAIPELFPENEAGLAPDISVSGVSARAWSQPFPRDYLNHTFASSFTFQRETHTWKAGVLIAVEHSDSNISQMRTQGRFTFGAGGGFSAFQNFLRGNPQGACGDSCRYTETDIDAVNRFRFGRYEAFVQDSWRIRPNLTLDLGLRYAFYPPLKDANDMLFTFSPDAYDPAKAPQFADEEGVYLVVGSGDFLNGYRIAGQNSPYGRSIYAADTNNLQPRLGAAWDPGGAGRVIVRAGYGIYFDQTQVGMFTQNVQETFTGVDPFRNDAFVDNVALSIPGRDPIQPPYAILTPQPFATSDPFVAPRWQHWNVGIQRRLYSRGMIDLSYVGSRGDHLLRYFDLNQPSAEDQ